MTKADMSRQVAFAGSYDGRIGEHARRLPLPTGWTTEISSWLSTSTTEEDKNTAV